MPAWANVQLPDQFVFSASSATPVQLGFAGPPVQVRPCGTVELAFLKPTVPPRATDAVEGRQE